MDQRPSPYTLHKMMLGLSVGFLIVFTLALVGLVVAAKVYENTDGFMEFTPITVPLGRLSLNPGSTAR